MVRDGPANATVRLGPSAAIGVLAGIVTGRPLVSGLS